jgi:pimeloyl-ACP methyl ester carboxylesterase
MQNTPRTLRQTAALLATAAGVAGAAGAQGTGPAAPDDPGAAPARPTVVLVHGAFADATAWARVIPLLERAGYTVVAVQNPLTAFDADVATTRRVIDAQPGPVVAVGHSYGGAVITQAAAGSDKVRALVYVAAFAPGRGRDRGRALGPAPGADGAGARDRSGRFLWLDRAKLRDVFARDVPEAETRVMAATQKPIHGSAFQATLTAAAWRALPSWFLSRRRTARSAPRCCASTPRAQAAPRWRSRRATCRSSRTRPEVGAPHRAGGVAVDGGPATRSGRVVDTTRVRTGRGPRGRAPILTTTSGDRS